MKTKSVNMSVSIKTENIFVSILLKTPNFYSLLSPSFSNSFFINIVILALNLYREFYISNLKRIYL